MSSFHPHKPAFKATADEVRRVAVISQQEIADTNPDQLCLIKRKVKQFDDLESSNNASWQTKVAAISPSRYKRIFLGSNMDRQRFRYDCYGRNYEEQTIILASLTAAFLV